MKLNLKLRLKNKATLTALISSVALIGNQIALLFGVDYSAQIEQLVNIAGTVLLLLSTMGVIVDGTSKGVSDSGMAMELTSPRDENIDPVEFKSEVDYTTEQFIDSQQEEVTESVDGLRDVDQEEIEAEEADEAPIGLGENESYEETQAPLSDPEVKGKEKSGGGHK